MVDIGAPRRQVVVTKPGTRVCAPGGAHTLREPVVVSREGDP